MPGITMNLQESISARLVVIGKLAGDAAILAILIPAESARRGWFPG